MPLVNPTLLQDEFPILTPIWDVALDPLRTRFWYTNDYPNEVWTAPSNLRGGPIAYLFKTPRSNPIPIYRHGLGRYSNRSAPGAKLIGYAESVKGEGMGELPIQNIGARERVLSAGARVGPDFMGYGYPMVPMVVTANSPIEFVQNLYPLEVSTPNRTDIHQISVRNGEAYRWRTIIPSAGIDRSWLWEPDNGAGFSAAEFWDEDPTGNPAVRLIHNPTLFGTRAYNPLAVPPFSDPHARLFSPLLRHRYGFQAPNSQAINDAETIPLEWSLEGFGNFAFRTDIEDHGNLAHQPCIWVDCRQRQVEEWNWEGREGVNRYRFSGYVPFPMVLTKSVMVAGLRTTDTFDTCYFYDCATDTLTDMGWDGNGDAGVSIRYTCTMADLRIENPPGVTFSVGASPCPSGYCAMIIRSTGNLYGPADDFTIAIVSRLLRPEFGALVTSHPRDMDSRLDRAQIVMAHHALVTPTENSGFRNAANFLASGKGRIIGWAGMQAFTLVDTFDNVMTQIRRLYSEGHLDDPTWTP